MNNYLTSRHIGITEADRDIMLQKLGLKDLDSLIKETIPHNILLGKPLELPEPLTERRYLEHIIELSGKNKLYTTYIGQGWYDTETPSVVLRNVFENPAWYTSYTPYQAEISQGRLEALLNFQTAVADFTGLPLANASLLDESTAAAEAVSMAYGVRSRAKVKAEANKVFVDENVFPQTLAVMKTRAEMQGLELVVGDYATAELTDDFFVVVVQYPNSNGSIEDYAHFTAQAHEKECLVAVAADILSLALLTPPAAWGADIVFGSTQRWGIPMYYGGPSAAFFATKEEYKRNIPGRIIGVSKDVNGKTALRMALQTREQHIKREKATSNICTAQALLATMASFYTVYHGAEGIRNITNRIHSIASYINEILPVYGFVQENENFFDTLKISLPENVKLEDLRKIALGFEVNFRYFDTGEVGLSIDETTDIEDVNTLINIFAAAAGNNPIYAEMEDIASLRSFDEKFDRKSDFLTHDVFNLYHTETEMMRYIKKLERRDISLAHSMISLGSCTMKLNAASELLPLSRPEWSGVHPLVPADQAEGYTEMLSSLEDYLSVLTGMDGTSLQPNSGAAGEFAGLVSIVSYLKAKGESQRVHVLIPASAHGTNPASAVQCGLIPVIVKSEDNGNVNVDDWNEKAEKYADTLAGCMITYPSTHGIFEPSVKALCETIHQYGGQVYMDGANMNAQVGLTNPGFIGADVCHLNLHKTFAIPHGGGGPGVGPICVKEHLIPHLPNKKFGENTVSAAPYGSAGVATITYGYIRMLGIEGLTLATETAILSANYLAELLKESYGIVYTGENGRVGHELILECRNFKKDSGVSETDIAKRLIDYGYHAPTLSFPVAGTLMIEPTESESLAELTRFSEAMLGIYAEIKEIENGTADKEDNVLVNAPHPEYSIVADEWAHPYPRTKAAYPADWVRENKFWVNVARVDNAYGDRNLVCTCPPMSAYENLED